MTLSSIWEERAAFAKTSGGRTVILALSSSPCPWSGWRDRASAWFCVTARLAALGLCDRCHWDLPECVCNEPRDLAVYGEELTADDEAWAKALVSMYAQDDEDPAESSRRICVGRLYDEE